MMTDVPGKTEIVTMNIDMGIPIRQYVLIPIEYLCTGEMLLMQRLTSYSIWESSDTRRALGLLQSLQLERRISKA